VGSVESVSNLDGQLEQPGWQEHHLERPFSFEFSYPFLVASRA